MVARALLLTIAALILASCDASKRSAEPSSERKDQIENSGRRLSGDFVVASIEDSYRGRRAEPQSSILSFDDAGRFKRQDNSRVEEGSYIIDTSGDLIVFIEKLNGEFLTSARIERYMIDDRHGDQAITLSGPSRSFVLTRR